MEKDRKETEHQVDKDGSVSLSTALLTWRNMQRGQRAVGKEITRCAPSCLLLPKGCKVNQGKPCSHPAHQRLRLVSIGVFFFQHTEMRLFHPSKKQTIWWSRRIWEWMSLFSAFNTKTKEESNFHQIIFFSFLSFLGSCIYFLPLLFI